MSIHHEEPLPSYDDVAHETQSMVDSIVSVDEPPPPAYVEEPGGAGGELSPGTIATNTAAITGTNGNNNDSSSSSSSIQTGAPSLLAEHQTCCSLRARLFGTSPCQEIPKQIFAYLILIGVCAAMPCVEVVFGAMYLYDCPANSFLPKWLIVAGCLWASLIIVAMLYRYTGRDLDHGPFVLVRFACFIWFFIGCYTTFSSCDGCDRTAPSEDPDALWCQPIVTGLAYWTCLGLIITLPVALLALPLLDCVYNGIVSCLCPTKDMEESREENRAVREVMQEMDRIEAALNRSGSHAGGGTTGNTEAEEGGGEEEQGQEVVVVPPFRLQRRPSAEDTDIVV